MSIIPIISPEAEIISVNCFFSSSFPKISVTASMNDFFSLAIEGAAYAPVAKKQIQTATVKITVMAIITFDFFLNFIIAPNLSFNCSAPSVKVMEAKELL